MRPRYTICYKGKKSELIKHPNGGQVKLGNYFAKLKSNKIKTIETKIYGTELKVTCLNLKKDYLLIVSNAVLGKKALIAYKSRWSIERTFKSIKTSGFNIEDTHITDQVKLSKLFAIVSIALAVCIITGKIKNDLKEIPTKKHGRKLYSFFTYGFDLLREFFIDNNNDLLKNTISQLLNILLDAISFIF